jgi:hypothetical protein
VSLDRHSPCGELSKLDRLLMYHGMTFSAENGPGLTFSCGTYGELIKINGSPPMA